MLYFQSGGAKSDYLLEHLLLESIDAVRGGGLFAWATRSGVQALIGDSVFTEFLESSPFELIVGLDSITDPRALRHLDHFQTQSPNLKATAFLNPAPKLFHPKVSWFEHRDGATTLVTGSGNLTIGGLRSNWEAFSVERLYGPDARTFHAKKETLVDQVRPDLVPLLDERAIARAEQNVGNERQLGPRVAPDANLVLTTATSVLIAEIPRSGNRWAQANFDQRTYVDFFGAVVGSQRRVMLYHVRDDAGLGDLESRPSVEVASQNYRFELAGAKALAYPAEAPPIGVFLRLESGEYLYTVELPADDGYSTLATFLGQHKAGRAGQMRRIQLSPSEFQDLWPEAPVLRAQLPSL